MNPVEARKRMIETCQETGSIRETARRRRSSRKVVRIWGRPATFSLPNYGPTLSPSRASSQKKPDAASTRSRRSSASSRSTSSSWKPASLTASTSPQPCGPSKRPQTCQGAGHRHRPGTRFDRLIPWPKAIGELLRAGGQGQSKRRPRPPWSIDQAMQQLSKIGIHRGGKRHHPPTPSSQVAEEVRHSPVRAH